MAVENELLEFFQWYKYHKDTLPPDDLKKRMEFLEKSITSMSKVLASVCEELAEKRQKSRLVFPSGVSVRGDLTRFG